MAGFTVEDFVRIETAIQPSYSSDGERVAFRWNRSGVPQAYVVEAGGGESRQLTDTGGVIYGVHYRPGRDQLLYVADDGGDEQYQLHLRDVAGGDARPLASDPQVIHDVGAWSEDGRLLSYSSNRRERAFFDVYVLDVDAGERRLVYRQDGMNLAGRFSAGGGQLLTSRPNLDLPGDNDLFVLDLDGGGESRLLTPHDGAAEWSQAHWHPAGAVLALSNEDRDFTALQRIDLDSGEREFLLEPDWDVELLAVAPGGGRLAAAVNEDGYSRLAVYELTSDARLGAEVATPEIPGGVISAPSWRPDGGALAFTFEGPRHTPNVFVADLEAGTLTQLTQAASRGIDAASLPEPQLIRYTTFDGRDVPAYYYLPPHAPRDGSLPCMVLVHGGPEGQSRPALWGRYAAPQYLLAEGRTSLLVPNVRGSTGYGKAYSHADDVELRMDSVRDLVAAVDWLAARPEIDARRVGVMGGSYGGFMVLAAITEEPKRWAAAVDLFGIANFETFLEHTGAWRRKHRAREYGEDPEFLRTISPIHNADRIRTPLMVVQGDHDVRVPPEESEQIVETVRRNEGIVEYIVFPNEGHGIQKLPHRLEMGRRIAAFLGEHLLGEHLLREGSGGGP